MKFCRVFLTIFDLRIKIFMRVFWRLLLFELLSLFSITVKNSMYFIHLSSEVLCWHLSNYWSKSHTVCYQYMRCTFLPQQRTLSRIEKVCVKYILQLLRKRLNLVMYQESLSMGILKYRNCRTKKMSGKSRQDLCNFYWKQLLALNVA